MEKDEIVRLHCLGVSVGPIPFTRWTERVAAPSALKSIAPFVHLPILNLPFLSYTEGPLSHPLSHRVTVFALDSSGTRTDSHSSGAHTSTCSPPLTLPSLSYRFSSLSSALSTHFPTPPPSIFPSTSPFTLPSRPPFRASPRPSPTTHMATGESARERSVAPCL